MVRLDFCCLAALLAVPRGWPPAGAADPPAEASPASRANDLLSRLAQSQDEDEAAGLVKSLEREWLRSGSDASDLLMGRALEAFAAENYGLALQLLDTVVATQPDWAEGWNKRAT